MNLLIKKFWEKNGVPIRSYQFSQHHLWFLCSDPGYYNQDGPPPPLRKDMVCRRSFDENKNWKDFYYFEDKIYSEKDMLRIIELKAFI